MKQQKLDWLRENYNILSSVILKAPTGDEKLSTPLLVWVGNLVRGYVEVGVRLPLSPFLQEWISRLGVAPHQMNPTCTGQWQVSKPSVVAASAWVRANHQSDAALFFAEDESVSGRLLLSSECGGEDN